jgi:hypothetical protein
MTQQRHGGHSGMSGLSQNMSQNLDFSQDSVNLNHGGGRGGASGTIPDGMLSQDSTYQGDRNSSDNNGGFLSQL